MGQSSDRFYKWQKTCLFFSLTSFLILLGYTPSQLVDSIPIVKTIEPIIQISHFSIMTLTFISWILFLVEWYSLTDDIKPDFAAEIHFFITSLLAWISICLTYIAIVCGLRTVPLYEWDWYSIIILSIASLISAYLVSLLLTAILLIRSTKEVEKYRLPRIPIMAKCILGLCFPVLLCFLSSMIFYGINIGGKLQNTWFYIVLPPVVLLPIITSYFDIKKNKNNICLLNDLRKTNLLFDYHQLLRKHFQNTNFHNEESSSARDLCDEINKGIYSTIAPAEEFTFIQDKTNPKEVLIKTENGGSNILCKVARKINGLSLEDYSLPCKYIRFDIAEVKNALKNQKDFWRLLQVKFQIAKWQYEIDCGRQISIDELIKIIAIGNTECFNYALKSNINLNEAGLGGWTPVLMAAAQGRFNFLKILLENGGDPNHQKLNEATALMHAAYHGDIKCMKILIEYGAKLDIQDCYGDTALIRAIMGKHQDAAIFLIKQGANKSIKDNDGMSALKFAEGKRLGKVAKLIRFNDENYNKKKKSELRKKKKKKRRGKK